MSENDIYVTGQERTVKRPCPNRNELIRKAATYAFSAVCGMTLTAALIFLSAFIMYIIGFPPSAAGFFSVFSFGAGCMLSGYVCGRIKGHAGLRHGFRCAVIMTVSLMLLSLISGGMDGSAAAVKTLTAVFTGCIGGVLGVNSGDRL